MEQLRETRFGIGLDPLDPPGMIIDQAILAESLGFGSVWISDSQVLWRDGYILMGIIASKTARLIIGSGVTNPITRHATVIAGSFSTMDELAPGRIALGIGVGDSAVRMIGRRPARIGELEEAVTTIGKLLKGEEVVEGEVRVKLNFPRPVPILIAATGPKAIAMSGRVGDGVLLWLTEPAFVEESIRTIRKEANGVGRDPDDFIYCGWIPCSIDDDPDEARRALRIHVARYLMHRPAIPAGVVDETVIEALRSQYDYHHHMEPNARHAELVPLNVVDRFALVGTARDVARQASAMLDTGLQHLVVIPRGDKERVMRAFATDVMPRVTQRRAS